MIDVDFRTKMAGNSEAIVRKMEVIEILYYEISK